MRRAVARRPPVSAKPLTLAGASCALEPGHGYIQFVENMARHPRLVFVLGAALPDDQVPHENALMAWGRLHCSDLRQLAVALGVLGIGHLDSAYRFTIELSLQSLPFHPDVIRLAIPT